MSKFKEPYVLVLIGPPCSGKTTYLKKKYPDLEVISRDQILLEKSGSSDDYDLAYETVNQKEVDKELKSKLESFGKSGKSCAIDMTNLSPKRRKSNLSYFKKHYKVAIVFDFPSKSQFEERNAKRVIEENKTIPWGVMEKMLESYSPPTKEEGFDKIISL